MTESPAPGVHPHVLKYKHLGIDTNQELVVYMPADCDVCRSEGYRSLTRLVVSAGSRSIIATLNITQNGLLGPSQLSLSESAVRKLGVTEGDPLEVCLLQTPDSLQYVRSKIYGNSLTREEYHAVLADIAAERYSNVELSAFVTACSAREMPLEEIGYMTQAMVDAGTKLSWASAVVADKHCIGGLPGNRTTLIVVPIVAALGITIPKTSSRAITSPAGTADTMETLAPVNLDLAQMRKVVEKENGCLVWGGSVRLSPADDIIIRVERALDIDSEEQMIASILSKKAAAGSTHCVIDVPVGPSAKVRSQPSAEKLKGLLEGVAKQVGMQVRVLLSDGTHPVGVGIGPALEARDCLKVLQNAPDAPADLRSRALLLAGQVAEMALGLQLGEGLMRAEEVLKSGKAWEKFAAICEAQGGMRKLMSAPNTHTVEAEHDFTVQSLDNRLIARLAKLAGAPDIPEAGLEWFVQPGQQVLKGQPLFTVHANSAGELNYALGFFRSKSPKIIEIAA